MAKAVHCASFDAGFYPSRRQSSPGRQSRPRAVREQRAGTEQPAHCRGLVEDL